jgi:hypothetical protein
MIVVARGDSKTTSTLSIGEIVGSVEQEVTETTEKH